ncbi:hypothetical protein MLD38_000388 [Melastoma candidum]|uniref:Uncharacterized protein n=1 Tax=Melastoma candidum TaxID=119954 RepID=A0ACB9SD61_9MYRT|nr:hypothetical protein MLD38_000388 [Melastoma candidum]
MEAVRRRREAAAGPGGRREGWMAAVGGAGELVVAGSGLGEGDSLPCCKGEGVREGGLRCRLQEDREGELGRRFRNRRGERRGARDSEDVDSEDVGEDAREPRLRGRGHFGVWVGWFAGSERGWLAALGQTVSDDIGKEGL